VVAIAAAVLLLGCGTESSSPAAGVFKPRTPGVLTVATSDIPSPGFWTGTPTHVTGGLEFELAKDMARRFGLKTVRVRLVQFHRVVGGDLGGADLGLDLITATPARERVLDFTSPYLNAPPTVVVRAGTSVPDLQTAQGLRWGVVRGTTFVSIVDTVVAPDAPVREFDSTSEVLAAIEDHRVGATLLDLPLALVSARQSGGRLQAAAQLAQSETIAVALPKGSDNVAAADSAIRAFTADGTIRRLERTWLGSGAADAIKSIPLLRTDR
jgi:polar amino acid transport system substrate-binding protein